MSFNFIKKIVFIQGKQLIFSSLYSIINYCDNSRPVGQVVKTRPSHGRNRGSTPLRVIYTKRTPKRRPFCVFESKGESNPKGRRVAAEGAGDAFCNEPVQGARTGRRRTADATGGCRCKLPYGLYTQNGRPSGVRFVFLEVRGESNPKGRRVSQKAPVTLIKKVLYH
jgi:hypothetical protein